MSAVIKLTVPGELVFRDVAIRAVAAACRLVRDSSTVTEKTGATLDLGHQFDAQLVSAVSEIFNNIVIHGYRSTPHSLLPQETFEQESDQGPAESTSESLIAPVPPIEFELKLDDYCLDIVITDRGDAFDIDEIPPPELESLPEGGMGIHIARSFVDELTYTAGPPNVWHLSKRLVRTNKPHVRATTQ